MNKVHYSSLKQDWTTPPSFFSIYNDKYKFVLDAACETHNCMCPIGFYFDKGIDALEQDWHIVKGYIWCNPPYGKHLKLFIKKAYDEWKKGAKIVMLIPSRTDTSYWHDYIFNHAKIEFIRGRLKFGESKNSAPFPSAVVIWD